MALGSDPGHLAPPALYRAKQKGKVLQGDRDANLHRVSRGGFPEEVTFKQRSEGGEMASHADICGKGASSTGNSVHKGSEVGPSLAWAP